MVELSTTVMSWGANWSTFTGDASTVSRGPLPETIRLRNPKTNGTCTFRYHSVQKDAEGEIVTFLYKGMSPKGEISLILFND